jgi:predicted dehydrogenase
MTNLGAHSLDVVDWVLGLDSLRSATSVGGRFALQDNGETPDTQDAFFEFPGWTAVWSMRECSLGERPAFGLAFFGTRGSLGLSRSGFKVTADSDVPPVNLIPGVQDKHPVGGPRAVPTPVPARLRTEAIEDRSGSSDEQYQGHVRNFLDCIKSRQPPIADLASAQRAATACHLANLSLRLGRKLRWDAKSQAIPGDEEANRWLMRPYRAPWDRELQALGIS